ncbi:DIP1281 family NlpC/P60 protein [uncultured Corynebacterium sp.]|uniref:DIP1281 family NlpC/P60 protein n=1 Tax=uncultured Corynebacterium sp. TaxID=159447 RepID=UPI002599308E|nr:NlpC/P60 family protein [uncultured Corynebacterium sp.]
MGNPRKGTRVRWVRTATSVIACSTTLSLAGTLVSPASRAQEGESSASALVAAISDAQARVDELDLGLGTLRENVNQALVDLHDAQSRAEQARRGVEEARKRLEESESAVEAARAELAEITRLQYRAQGSPSALAGLSASEGGDKQKDVLDRSLYLRQQSEEKQAKLAEVERARTEAANEESTLRETSRLAEQTAAEAESAERDAREKLDANQRELEQRTAERSAAESELKSAQQELDDARPGASAAKADNATATATPAPEPKKESAPVDPEVAKAVREKLSSAAPDAPEPTDEQISSAISTAETAAERAGDSAGDATAEAAAIAAATALIGSSQAEHTELDNPYSGSNSAELIAAFSRGLSSALGSAQSAATEAPGVEEVLPDVDTAESVTDKISSALTPAANTSKVETVIARAQSMIGTPYVWGGGDANGPTSGLEGGQKGFDCSGLVLYAFAAAGVSLPHYTGYQYQRGTQIDPSEAQRGDLLFWGPEGSQHVAIYLGDGTMIEAPQSGQNVQISPVRYGGMSAKAVRLL